MIFFPFDFTSVNAPGVIFVHKIFQTSLFFRYVDNNTMWTNSPYTLVNYARKKEKRKEINLLQKTI